MVVLLWNVVSRPSYSVKKKWGGGYFRRSSFVNIVVEGSDNPLWFMLFRFNAVGVGAVGFTLLPWAL
jgi:hypothetical protein